MPGGASGWSLNQEQDRPSSSPSPPPGESGQPATGSSASGGGILIVEDNPGDVSLIRTALRLHSIQLPVTVLTDGEKASQYFDAVEAGETPCPALVVLDLNLPRRSGLDILKQIRRSAKACDAVVLVFSSSAAERDMRAVAEVGAAAYVQKPSDIDQFLKVGERIKSLLGGGRAG